MLCFWLHPLILLSCQKCVSQMLAVISALRTHFSFAALRVGSLWKGPLILVGFVRIEGLRACFCTILHMAAFTLVLFD